MLKNSIFNINNKWNPKHRTASDGLAWNRAIPSLHRLTVQAWILLNARHSAWAPNNWTSHRANNKTPNSNRVFLQNSAFKHRFAPRVPSKQDIHKGAGPETSISRFLEAVLLYRSLRYSNPMKRKAFFVDTGWGKSKGRAPQRTAETSSMRPQAVTY